jgi:signal transduction histidine kinase
VTVAATPESSRAIEDRLFRALAILRVVVTVNMVVLNGYRAPNYEHPTAGLVVVVGLVAWTGLALWLYDAARRRTAWLLGADMAVALTAIALTPWVKTASFNATIPGFWVMGALLAWAIVWHWKGGLAAGLALSALDLGLRDSIDQTNYGNVFLLLLGGPIVGYMVASLQRMAAERDAALRSAAVAEERTRLARVVHDGVLQVLSMVQRDGVASPDPGWQRLGAMAGEQERSLRSLIRQQDAVATVVAGRTDVGRGLESLGSRHQVRVEVVTPGHPVWMDSDRAAELLAAVEACIDNLAAHVGRDATAWVLLEETPSTVAVSVRDEGPGIPAARLDEARDEGRLGVVQSICGRIEDLGGAATLSTGDWGTEWELEVPR